MKKNENKGFSLVELIVVIAIMAVLVAVLAPALLSYVERSRAQKDDSAMSEVANAVQLALADQKIYDEFLLCNVAKNYKAYVQGEDEYSAGLAVEMRGVTITFCPEHKPGEKDWSFTLENGYINDIPTYRNNQTTTTKEAKSNFVACDYLEGAAHTDRIQFSHDDLKNALARVESVIGKTVKITSQTYRNSDYTIFVEMASIKDGKNNGIRVKGEWNGTNLYVTDASGIAAADKAINGQIAKAVAADAEGAGSSK